MKKQQMYFEGNDMEEAIFRIIEETHAKKIFVVCGKSFYKRELKKKLDQLKFPITYFSDFEPNPTYESAVEGTKLFRQNNCDFLIAVGGGSAIDLAKCVKMFSKMEPQKNYLEQPPKENQIPFLSVPTTAGTGSEATQFAVIYKDGEKKSVSHEMLLPDYVCLVPQMLESLSEYQRKVTMLDVLCHAIESFWSVRSTETSRVYSKKALEQFSLSWEGYLKNTREGNQGMLHAANTAGKAINLAQTTAAHAMSYKLTALYRIPHGYAAALCLTSVWGYLIRESETEEVEQRLSELANIMNCESAAGSLKQYKKFLKDLKLPNIQMKGKEELEVLTKSVNQERLKNFPVLLKKEDLRKLYGEILGLEEESDTDNSL